MADRGREKALLPPAGAHAPRCACADRRPPDLPAPGILHGPAAPTGVPCLTLAAMGAVLLLAISLALHAEPPRLILGERSRVELEILAPGAPADARLELWTSAGRIVEVRREKGDLFRAVYQRPKERFPRVALLLAKLHAYGVEDRAWLALPLIASEKLPVHTKPGSRVEL